MGVNFQLSVLEFMEEIKEERAKDQEEWARLATQVLTITQDLEAL